MRLLINHGGLRLQEVIYCEADLKMTFFRGLLLKYGICHGEGIGVAIGFATV